MFNSIRTQAKIMGPNYRASQIQLLILNRVGHRHLLILRVEGNLVLLPLVVPNYSSTPLLGVAGAHTIQ